MYLIFQKMDPELAKKHKGTEYWQYTFRDSIIYALGGEFPQ